MLEQGDHELSVNMESGAERYVDRSRFHASPGTTRTLSDEEYVVLAARHARAVLGADVAGGGIYPFKLRRYQNAVAQKDGAPTETTYQIAVAFNSIIDGLSVVGAGGKLVVHMTPDGQVVSHEATLRSVASVAAILTSAELLRPSQARAEVEARLLRRDVTLKQYTLSRAELGYYRLGRRGVQSLVAPHYVYVYEPNEHSGFARRIVEIIPAVAERSLLQRLFDDQLPEDKRRARILSRAAVPSQK